MLTKLPGYAADPAPASVSVLVPAPTLSYSAGSTINPTTASYQPGGIFAVSAPPAAAPSTSSSAALPTTTSTSTPEAPATTAPPSLAQAVGTDSKSYFSTTFITSGRVVEEVLWVEEVVTVTQETTTTVMVPGKHRRHLHQHAAHHVS
jgi:hypothetical protein